MSVDNKEKVKKFSLAELSKHLEDGDEIRRYYTRSDGNTGYAIISEELRLAEHFVQSSGSMIEGDHFEVFNLRKLILIG